MLHVLVLLFFKPPFLSPLCSFLRVCFIFPVFGSNFQAKTSFCWRFVRCFPPPSLKYVCGIDEHGNLCDNLIFSGSRKQFGADIMLKMFRAGWESFEKWDWFERPNPMSELFWSNVHWMSWREMNCELQQKWRNYSHFASTVLRRFAGNQQVRSFPTDQKQMNRRNRLIYFQPAPGNTAIQ